MSLYTFFPQIRCVNTRQVWLYAVYSSMNLVKLCWFNKYIYVYICKLNWWYIRSRTQVELDIWGQLMVDGMWIIETNWKFDKFLWTICLQDPKRLLCLPFLWRAELTLPLLPSYLCSSKLFNLAVGRVSS